MQNPDLNFPENLIWEAWIGITTLVLVLRKATNKQTHIYTNLILQFRC